MRFLTVAALGLALAGPACSQAPTPEQAAVPTTIEAAFREAMTLSPTPHAVAETHRYWTQDGADANDERYLDELQRRIRQDRIARAARPTPEALTEACVEVVLKSCSVSASGAIRAGDGRRLWWQVQDGYTEEDGVGGGVMVFDQSGEGPLTPVLWAFEAGRYEAPVLVDRDGGFLLVAPGVSRGNGAGDSAVMALWRDAAWRPVDTSWQGRAGDLLAGREVRHRPYWYLQEMMAMTPLWRPRDSQCCGEAGVALLSFDIVEDRLTLTDLHMLSPRDR